MYRCAVLYIYNIKQTTLANRNLYRWFKDLGFSGNYLVKYCEILCRYKHIVVYDRFQAYRSIVPVWSIFICVWREYIGLVRLNLTVEALIIGPLLSLFRSVHLSARTLKSFVPVNHKSKDLEGFKRIGYERKLDWHEQTLTCVKHKYLHRTLGFLDPSLTLRSFEDLLWTLSCVFRDYLWDLRP